MIAVGGLAGVGSTTVLASPGPEPEPAVIVSTAPTTSTVAAAETGADQAATTTTIAIAVATDDIDVTAATDDVDETGVLHVSTHGVDAGADGTDAEPYGSIGAAVRAAPPGSTIVVAAGVYREQVDVDRPVSIVAARGDRPWLSGADVVDTWTSEGGRWWTPAPAVEREGWSAGMIGAEPAGLVDLVVVDGRSLSQVASATGLVPGTFFVDRAVGRVWLDDDPTGHVVEVGSREHALVLRSVPGARIEGLGVRHYATAPGDRGAIEISGGGVTLVDLVVRDNSNAGVQAVGMGIEIIGLTAAGNGRLGVNAHHADGLMVRHGTFTDNNTEGYSFRGAAGGLKVTASRDVLIESSIASDNGGSGIWIDMSSVGVTIRDNTTDRNTKAGVFVEVSALALVENNSASGNSRGIEINESNDVVVRGNVVTGNIRGIFVVDGLRDGESCIDRGIDATFSPPVDSRVGCQWPLVKWDLDNVEISGNTLIDGDPGDTERAMLEVNHVAHPDRTIDRVDRRPAADDMNITTFDNLYHRSVPGRPLWTVAWTGGDSMAVFETLAAYQAATGQGSGSVEAS